MLNNKFWLLIFKKYYLSAFVIWSKSELQTFVKTFTSQVCVSKATLTMVAECVSEARKRCDQVRFFTAKNIDDS